MSKLHISVFILAAALLLLASTAYAGTTCQVIGNFTYCTTTDPQTGQMTTTTCQVIGQFVYCN